MQKVFLILFVGVLGIWVSQQIQKTPIVNVEALAGVIVEENDMVGSYAWSPEIDCPGWFNGDYQVCQVNGPQAACFVPGAVTCDCGENCD